MKEALKLARETFIARGFWPNEVMWACWRDAWLAGVAIERETYALSKTLTQDIDAPLTLNGVALWPKRPWVDLTDEQIDVIYEQHHNQYGECESPNFGYERAIEAKLKEKNS
jgi:hypothetical protein